MGFRAYSKAFIPQFLWPLGRWIDKIILKSVYLYFYFRRRLFDLRNNKLIEGMEFPLYTFVIPGYDPLSESLSDYLKRKGFFVQEGRHSIYISLPQEIDALCPGLLDRYPKNVGLKIVKSQEDAPDNSRYYTSYKLAHASTVYSMKAVGTVFEKVIISNLLNMHKCAPRVYGNVKLTGSDFVFDGLIVQNIEGITVRGDDGVRFIKRFKSTLQKLGLGTVSIKEHSDLLPPLFRDNIRSDGDNYYYVDIQNFIFLRSFTEKDIAYTSYDRVCGKKEESISSYCLENETESWRRRYQCLKHTISEFHLWLAGVLGVLSIDYPASRVLDKVANNDLLAMYFMYYQAAWVDLYRKKDEVILTEKMLYFSGFARFTLLDENEYGQEECTDIERYQIICVDLEQINSLPRGINNYKDKIVIVACFTSVLDTEVLTRMSHLSYQDELTLNSVRIFSHEKVKLAVARL